MGTSLADMAAPCTAGYWISACASRDPPGCGGEAAPPVEARSAAVGARRRRKTVVGAAATGSRWVWGQSRSCDPSCELCELPSWHAGLFGGEKQMIIGI
jgi:hypothetical protein